MAKKVDKNYILFLFALGFTALLVIFYNYRRKNRIVEAYDTMIKNPMAYPQPLVDTSFPKIQTNLMDTAFPLIFEAAYSDSTYVTWGNETGKMTKAKVGKIKITTGRLVAGDHVMFNTYKPFNMDFPIGSFDVELSMNKWSSASFIRIVFSKEKVVRWEYPEYYGEERKPITLLDYYPGFGVDAGMAFIADSAVHRSLVDANAMPPFLEDKIATIEQLGPYTYANFISGEGDGFYASYVGYDKDGKICRFLIDFNSIRWI